VGKQEIDCKVQINLGLFWKHLIIHIGHILVEKKRR
jgi:hypothetical protein